MLRGEDIKIHICWCVMKVHHTLLLHLASSGGTSMFLPNAFGHYFIPHLLFHNTQSLALAQVRICVEEWTATEDISRWRRYEIPMMRQTEYPQDPQTRPSQVLPLIRFRLYRAGIDHLSPRPTRDPRR